MKYIVKKNLGTKQWPTTVYFPENSIRKSTEYFSKRDQLLTKKLMWQGYNKSRYNARPPIDQLRNQML
jgi:hypothetical protein